MANVLDKAPTFFEQMRNYPGAKEEIKSTMALDKGRNETIEKLEEMIHLLQSFKSYGDSLGQLFKILLNY